MKNTGDVTSDFVALLFLAGEHGSAPHPIKDLVGYDRLRAVEPGDRQEATVSLRLAELARVDEKGNTVLYPGTYEVLVDVPTQARATFELVGEAETLIEFPQPPPDLGEGNGHDG